MSDRVMDGDWRLFSEDKDAGTKTWFLDIGDHLVFRTDYYAKDELIDLNTARANDSIGKKWGDGQIAASVPLPLFYQKLAEPTRQKDHAYIRRFLNDPDHARLRTFGGRI
jgi:hypothetical protein